MLRLAIIILLLLFVLNSCDNAQKDSNKIEEVIKLQEKSLKNSTDSSFAYLKLAEKYLKEKPFIFPDSLRAKNNYLLGIQFKEKGQLDSALVRFHLATDFVGDSIIREAQAEYYNEAWSISMNLEKYGDCLVILERYRAALGDKNFRKLWLKSFYNDVWTYKQMQHFSKALEINKFQEPLTREIDPINIPTLLISRADLKYRYLKDKNGAFAILDSLIANHKNLTSNNKRQIYGKYGVFSYYEGCFKKL